MVKENKNMTINDWNFIFLSVGYLNALFIQECLLQISVNIDSFTEMQKS